MKFIPNMARGYAYLAAGLIACLTVACTPDEADGDLGPAPTSQTVEFTATPTTGNPNIVTFTNQTPGSFKAIWDLGNGITEEGDQVSGSYALQGEYTVKLTVFTRGGYATNTKTVQIAKTDFSMLDRPDYNALTGGPDAAQGKTWVFDPVGSMNFGGPPAAPSSWWNQKLADQPDCMKDDKYTFTLEGFRFQNQSGAAMWGILDGVENQCVPQTPATNSTWRLYEANGKTMLSVSNGESIAWDDNDGVYEVMELTENRLHIRKSCCGGEGVRNYVLVPEGFMPEVQPRPYRSVDIQENFDGTSTVTWSTDALTFNPSYDNPAPVGINTSPKVGMYIKKEGAGFAFANLNTRFAHTLDIRQRNVIKLKVFIPSYNDFTTEAGESWAIRNLLKQVSVKLQDGTSGEPWVTQAEVKQQVTQLDRWVELTFDFSQYASRTDFDKVLIQIGGEGNYIPAVFFIDDIRLEP